MKQKHGTRPEQFSVGFMYVVGQNSYFFGGFNPHSLRCIFTNYLNNRKHMLLFLFVEVNKSLIGH